MLGFVVFWLFFFFLAAVCLFHLCSFFLQRITNISYSCWIQQYLEDLCYLADQQFSGELCPGGYVEEGELLKQWTVQPRACLTPAITRIKLCRNFLAPTYCICMSTRSHSFHCCLFGKCLTNIFLLHHIPSISFCSFIEGSDTINLLILEEDWAG